MNSITVIRLSQRGYRDQRITTHCCLVARAFGAQKIILATDQDPKIKETIQKVNRQFGGTFEIEYAERPIQQITRLKKEGHRIIHLTMYGEKPQKITQQKTGNEKWAIIIGANKVPHEIYQQADYNISITRQPHSEVAALALMLHYIQNGEEENMIFEHATNRIVPMSRGKKVVKAAHH